MATARQIAANRANAKKSTGPRTPEGKAIVARNGARSRGPKTPEGKARSRLNALKHGLRAATPLPQLLQAAEPAARFAAFRDSLRADVVPTTREADAVVDVIAACFWRLRRAFEVEGDGIAAAGGECLAADTLRLVRYEAHLDRLLYRALDLLERSRAGDPTVAAELAGLHAPPRNDSAKRTQIAPGPAANASAAAPHARFLPDEPKPTATTATSPAPNTPDCTAASDAPFLPNEPNPTAADSAQHHDTPHLHEPAGLCLFKPLGPRGLPSRPTSEAPEAYHGSLGRPPIADSPLLPNEPNPIAAGPACPPEAHHDELAPTPAGDSHRLPNEPKPNRAGGRRHASRRRRRSKHNKKP